MLRFDVSPLVGAQLGASLVLDVESGPSTLIDLQVVSLRGVVQVTRVQGSLLAQGTVQAELQLECVRCLEPFVLPVTLELEETYTLPGVAPESEESLAVREDGTLDLTPLLRDQGWLAIPMKPLCSKDCRGICPICGANLNQTSCDCAEQPVDPRLSALARLLH
jgi:uncharacterized protein